MTISQTLWLASAAALLASCSVPDGTDQLEPQAHSSLAPERAVRATGKFMREIHPSGPQRFLSARSGLYWPDCGHGGVGGSSVGIIIEAYQSGPLAQRFAYSTPAPPKEPSHRQLLSLEPLSETVEEPEVEPQDVVNTLFVEWAEAVLSHNSGQNYSLDYTFPGEIVDVSSRGVNDYFLLCRDDQQALTVERWQIVTAPGGWKADRAEAPASGVPLPAVAKATPEIEGDGPNIEVRSREFYSYATCTELLQGVSIRSDAFQLLVDPDARFVLLISPLTIERIDLFDSSVTQLLSATDFDPSARSIYFCVMTGKAGAGRVLEISVDGPQYGALAFDSDNDGVFEKICGPAPRSELDPLLPKNQVWGGGEL